MAWIFYIFRDLYGLVSSMWVWLFPFYFWVFLEFKPLSSWFLKTCATLNNSFVIWVLFLMTHLPSWSTIHKSWREFLTTSLFHVKHGPSRTIFHREPCVFAIHCSFIVSQACLHDPDFDLLLWETIHLLW